MHASNGHTAECIESAGSIKAVLGAGAIAGEQGRREYPSSSILCDLDACKSIKPSLRAGHHCAVGLDQLHAGGRAQQLAAEGTHHEEALPATGLVEGGHIGSSIDRVLGGDDGACGAAQQEGSR